MSGYTHSPSSHAQRQPSHWEKGLVSQVQIQIHGLAEVLKPCNCRITNWSVLYT